MKRDNNILSYYTKKFEVTALLDYRYKSELRGKLKANAFKEALASALYKNPKIKKHIRDVSVREDKSLKYIPVEYALTVMVEKDHLADEKFGFSTAWEGQEMEARLEEFFHQDADKVRSVEVELLEDKKRREKAYHDKRESRESRERDADLSEDVTCCLEENTNES